MDANQLMTDFAAAHHGLTHMTWLRDVGISRGVLEAQVRAGRLESPFLGVYRIAGAPVTWKTNLLAACWAGGLRAAASHRSAAAIWELPGSWREVAEITCPRWRRARHEGLIIHETKMLNRADTTERDAIPVTTVERTLVDLGAVCAPVVVEMALDSALRRTLVTYRSVFQLLDRIGKQGRNGVGVLRQILRDRGDDQRPTESPMETLLLRLIRGSGLPVPTPQVEIYNVGRFVARVDFAYPEAKLVVEYDSDAHHLGSREMQRDNRRRNRIVAAGWTVLVATRADTRDGGRDICRAIHAHLDRFGVVRPAI
jgi:very-short-patch-repair endonuclease